jgi:hypothetical protein
MNNMHTFSPLLLIDSYLGRKIFVLSINLNLKPRMQVETIYVMLFKTYIERCRGRQKIHDKKTCKSSGTDNNWRYNYMGFCHFSAWFFFLYFSFWRS